MRKTKKKSNPHASTHGITLPANPVYGARVGPHRCTILRYGQSMYMIPYYDAAVNAFDAAIRRKGADKTP